MRRAYTPDQGGNEAPALTEPVGSCGDGGNREETNPASTQTLDQVENFRGLLFEKPPVSPSLYIQPYDRFGI